jgi:hypothetical protein
MEKNNNIGNINDNDIFNGKLVIKEYDFFNLGNVKVLYPNQDDMEFILELMITSAKADDKGMINIDIDIFDTVYKIMPRLTNIDVSDVTKENIEHYVKIGHPELLEIVNDIANIVKSFSDLFAKVILDKAKE